MPDKRKSKMVEFSSETVIFDEKGNRVIACPTEQEAVEYVREQGEHCREDVLNAAIALKLAMNLYTLEKE